MTSNATMSLGITVKEVLAAINKRFISQMVAFRIRSIASKERIVTVLQSTTGRFELIVATEELKSWDEATGMARISNALLP